jgi:RHS repeat-associated protein
VDSRGNFLQDVDYQPFGEAQSSGVLPGTPQYTSAQWNGGDALAAFCLSYLGARLYDPVIGRFLSRDPLILPRSAATTNAYAFAMNDPVNLSDPSGMDCGPECRSPVPDNGIPGGGASTINPPGLYLPPGVTTSRANPRAANRLPVPPTLLSAPQVPQTTESEGTAEDIEKIDKGDEVLDVLFVSLEHFSKEEESAWWALGRAGSIGARGLTLGISAANLISLRSWSNEGEFSLKLLLVLIPEAGAFYTLGAAASWLSDYKFPGPPLDFRDLQTIAVSMSNAKNAARIMEGTLSLRH